MLGDPVVAEQHSHHALELAQRLNDRYLQIEARILLAQTLNYAGHPNRVAAILEDDFAYLGTAMRHARQGQTMIRSVVAATNLSTSFAAMAEFERSQTYEDQAIAIADEAGRPFDQMYAQWAKGIRLDYQGDFKAAVAAHQKSTEIAEANDLWFMTTFAQPWLGHALIADGRPKKALKALSAIEAAAKRVELPYVEALSQVFGAQAAQALGHDDDARRQAHPALAFNDAYPNPLIEFAALSALARLESRAQRQAILQKAAEIAARSGFHAWMQRIRDDLSA